MFAEWIGIFRRAGKEFLADDCMGLAKEVAYSALLAFFPAAAFLLGLFGVLHLYDQLQSLLATVVPHGVTTFIDGLQRDQRGSTKVFALVIGGAGAVWTASGAMESVIKAVNRAYERTETRPFWRLRLTAIGLVLLTGVTLVALAVLIVFGGPIGQALADKANLGGAFTTIWSLLRWPLAFGTVLLLLGFVYTFGPNGDDRFRWVSPGSLLATVLWLVLSGLLTLYVSYAGNYTKTYGTLAAGVILMLWLNYTAWAILFGAELNTELERRARLGGAELRAEPLRQGAHDRSP
jgi:membrane protein